MTTTLRPLGPAWPLPSSVPAEPRRRLEAWLDLLATWNARIDLTAARGAEELVDLMVADAMVLAERVPVGQRVVDVGAGAGAPGLALAILRPDLSVRLVEPLAKRVAFLRTVVGSIGATGVAIERGRGEDVARRGDVFDVAISRATLAPAAWLALGLELAPSVWVLLAKDAPPAAADAELVDDVAYPWPLTKVDRRAARYARRRSATRSSPEVARPPGVARG